MSTFTEALQSAQRIAVAGHVRPDGDCVGSALAVYNYVRANAPEKEVKVYLGNFALKFLFLPGSEHVLHKLKPEEESFDLFVCCDVSNKERLGEFSDLCGLSKKTFCIDHHMTNEGFADTDIIKPDASSTCELLYTLLDPEKIDVATATCLYHGLVHDTGVFQYSCTTAKTLEVAAALSRFEMPDRSKCIDSFYSKTFAGLHIWGCIMERAKLAFDGQCVYSCATWKDLKKYRAESMDMEGVVSEMMNTEKAVCSVFIYQNGETEYKVSLRSKGDFDVAAVASGFHGGGHRNASGCTCEGSLEEVTEAILKAVGEKLEDGRNI